MCPQKIITRAKVPLKCNFANKSALFPQAAPCPFSILGRTLYNTVQIRQGTAEVRETPKSQKRYAWYRSYWPLSHNPHSSICHSDYTSNINAMSRGTAICSTICFNSIHEPNSKTDVKCLPNKMVLHYLQVWIVGSCPRLSSSCTTYKQKQSTINTRDILIYN